MPGHRIASLLEIAGFLALLSLYQRFNTLYKRIHFLPYLTLQPMFLLLFDEQIDQPYFLLGFFLKHIKHIKIISSNYVVLSALFIISNFYHTTYFEGDTCLTPLIVK